MFLPYFLLVYLLCCVSVEAKLTKGLKPTKGVNSWEDQWFAQKLDHFNKSDETEWKQRFWQNDNYYDEAKKIQFLHIGGEGPESSYFLHSPFYAMVYWGKQLGARLWNLEHRFYGQSHPKEDLSTENLKYLSGRQALEDLANFIRTKNKELNLKNPKWVTFGYSYSGSLSLWMRLKYPDLVIGALGSSGPMKIAVDFPEYNNVTENAYRSYSQNCANSIRDAIQKVDTLIKTKEGQKQLDELLHLHPTIASQSHLSDTQIWNLFDAFGNGLATQYGSSSSVEQTCQIMGNEQLDLVTRLYKAIKPKMGYFYMSIDYYGDVKKLKETYYGGPGRTKDGADRAWLWQECTGYGWFQNTARNGSGIFGKTVPIDYYYNQCEDIFGKDEEYVNEAIKKAIEFYGTVESYNATNVVITHGSIDPWSALGIHKSKNPSMITIMINGTSHCSDYVMNDWNPAIKEAQKIALENIQNWIIERN